MATLRFTLSSRLGSQLTIAPGPDNPDRNDFKVRITADENVSGLTTSGITLKDGWSVVSIEGSNAAWEATVRPPRTADTATFTVNTDAFAEGNPETSLTIRVSTSFPDADAETPTQLFTLPSGTYAGIAVSPTRLMIAKSETGDDDLLFFSHAGTEQTSEKLVDLFSSLPDALDYFNQTVISSRSGAAPQRFSLTDGEEIPNDSVLLLDALTEPAVHTNIGVLQIRNDFFRIADYNERFRNLDSITLPIADYTRMAHQNGLLYLIDDNSSDTSFGLVHIASETDIQFITTLNIDRDTVIRDIAIYRDTLYIHSVTNRAVLTLDIRKYRPMATNTKTRIYPVFATNGDRIDLTQFAPDAETFVWEVGFDLPTYLSIDATSNELVIASDAVSVETPVLVKLTGINRVDATARDALGFYLILQPAVAPVWRDVDALTMRANATFDMHQIVDADAISLQSGPTGSSLSNGVFRIATTGGTATFRATKGSLTADVTINITVVQASDPANFSDNFKYRTEIAGIDVSEDVLVSPSVSISLDAVTLNEYIPNEIELTLKSDDQNGYKYTDGIANNFWESNNLNPTGFRVPIQVFIDSEVGGSTVSHLLFSGIILRMRAPIGAATAEVECVDISELLRETLVQDFGTLTKWDALRQQTDEVTYQGVYLPEGSLTPMQFDTGEAWEDRTPLTLRRLALPSEGPPLTHQAYLTPTQLHTSGGFLDENPVLKVKTQHRSEDIRFLVAQLGLNKVIYNTEVNLPTVETDAAYILNRGSVSYSIEDTRNTRLLTDWVHDATNDRVLMLLHNPENHIADQIVQYNVNDDTYRTLYTFDKDIKAHRIERRNATNYYILTSGAIAQDRSAATLPRATDDTGYAYDSVAEGSVVRIHHYNAATNTLTEHVAEDDTYPPQLGVHYSTGFENPLYTDEFEGTLPYDRGAFKWGPGSHLYYRYAKDGEFGVARVDTAGTTQRLLDNSTDVEIDAFFAARTDGQIRIVPAATGNQKTPTGNFFQSFIVMPRGNLGMTIDAGNIYHLSNGSTITVFPTNTPDGGTATAIRSFTLPTGVANTGLSGITKQGNALYLYSRTNRRVSIVPADTADGTTATLTRQFNVDFADLTNGSGLEIRGNELFIANRSNNALYIVAANTPNGDDATLRRFFTLPSNLAGSVEALALYGDSLAVTNPRKIVLVDADTPNNDTATALREINIDIISAANLTALGLGLRSFNLGDTLNYKQSLSFGFDVTSTGTVYFAQTLAVLGFSVLIIKRRVGTTETTVFVDTKPTEDLTDLDTNGGTYQGVQECLFHNNFLYLLVEVGRIDVDTATPSRRKAAGMVLYRVNITASDPSLTVLETYDYVQRGACNLTVHDGSVHFVENPPASAQFRPINPDLDDYSESMGYNTPPEELGALKRVNSSGTVESLGNLLYEQRPYNVAATRCLSIGDDLHVGMGYGDLRALLRFNSLVSQADNVQHLVYGNTLRYVLPTFETQGTHRYTLLADLAQKTNAILSFENGLIVLMDREPYRAETDGATGTGTANLDFTDANKTFPSSGYLSIGKEFIGYTGISSSAFTGISRGALGTAIADHADAETVLYVNHVIGADRLKQENFNFTTDSNRLYNIITNPDNTAEQRDTASIAQYGERPYTLNLGLTQHELTWQEHIFSQYLENLKDLKQLVNLVLKPTNYLQANQVVGLKFAELVYSLQIVEIAYGLDETVIGARSV